MSDARAALERELHGTIPGLDRLSDAELAKLLAQIKRAHAHQEKELARVFEETLSHLPFLLRGPVRKLFESEG